MQIADFFAECPTHAEHVTAAAPDVRVPNACLRLAHAAARAFLSASWPLRPHAADCQATIEAFSWAGRGPHALLRRLQHTCTTSSTLRLPRGRHVLRATADPHATHAITVWSDSAFEFADRPELTAAAADCELFFKQAAEEVPAAAAGTWHVLCRHTFTLPQPARVAVRFRAAPVATHRSLSVLLVDNDTSTATPLVLAARPAEPLPVNEGGYTIMVIQDAALGDVPVGSYSLRLSSDVELGNFAAVPSSRVERFDGAYAPNRHGEVWRFALSPMAPCQVALRLQVHPPGLAGRLRLEADAGSMAAGGKGGGGKKGAAPPPRESGGGGGVVFSADVAGDDVVPVVRIPAGRHVLTLTLDRDRSALDVRPTGHVAGVTEADAERGPEGGPGGARWEVVLAPTADDKACPIAMDTSREVEQQAWLKEWVESRPGGAKERPRRGQEALGRLEELLVDSGPGQAPTVVRSLVLRYLAACCRPVCSWLFCVACRPCNDCVGDQHAEDRLRGVCRCGRPQGLVPVWEAAVRRQSTERLWLLIRRAAAAVRSVRSAGGVHPPPGLAPRDAPVSIPQFLHDIIRHHRDCVVRLVC